MTAGWYRSYYETPSGQRPTTVHVSPSVIYMIGKPNYTREVDIRPFVGGGASYLRATRPIVSPTANILTVESSGTSTRSAARSSRSRTPVLALSGELIYYRLPVQLPSRSSLDGLNYLVAVHFYLK